MSIKDVVKNVINETLRDPRNIQRSLNSEAYKLVDIYAPKVFQMIEYFYNSGIGLDGDFDTYWDNRIEIKSFDKKVGWFGLQFNLLTLCFDSENEDDYGMFSPANDNDYEAIIVFNPKKLNTLNKVRETFVHELTHVLDWCDAQHENYYDTNVTNKFNEIIDYAIFLTNASEIQARIQQSIELAKQLINTNKFFYNEESSLFDNIDRLKNMVERASKISLFRKSISALTMDVTNTDELSYAAKMLNINYDNVPSEMLFKQVKGIMNKRINWLEDQIEIGIKEVFKKEGWIK